MWNGINQSPTSPFLFLFTPINGEEGAWALVPLSYASDSAWCSQDLSTGDQSEETKWRGGGGEVCGRPGHWRSQGFQQGEAKRASEATERGGGEFFSSAYENIIMPLGIGYVKWHKPIPYFPFLIFVYSNQRGGGAWALVP